jgi:hypothetical protein
MCVVAALWHILVEMLEEKFSHSVSVVPRAVSIRTTVFWDVTMSDTKLPLSEETAVSIFRVEE